VLLAASVIAAPLTGAPNAITPNAVPPSAIVQDAMPANASLPSASCAPELASRKILIITLGKPESVLDDNAPMPKSTGERRVLQAFARAAQANEFQVDVYNVPQWCEIVDEHISKTGSCEMEMGNGPGFTTPQELATSTANQTQGNLAAVAKAKSALNTEGYHRVIFDWWAEDLCTSVVSSAPELKKSIMMVSYWGMDPGGKESHKQSAMDSVMPYNCGLAPHQILTPFPDPYNTFVGAHVAPLVTTPPVNRERIGLIYAKNPRSIDPNYEMRNGAPIKHGVLCVREGSSCVANSAGFGTGAGDDAAVLRHVRAIPSALAALINSNITLYSTLPQADFEALTAKGTLPPGIINKDKKNATQFNEMLDSMSFLLGIGFPLNSPAPLEALNHGVAFLNPSFPRPLMVPFEGSQGTQTSQHDHLQTMVGAPYNYIVDFRRPSTLVEAATKSFSDRFSSFIPYDLTPERIKQRVCMILSYTTWPANITEYDRSEYGRNGAKTLNEKIYDNVDLDDNATSVVQS